MNVYTVTGGPKSRLLGTVLGHNKDDALKRARSFWPTSTGIRVTFKDQKNTDSVPVQADTPKKRKGKSKS